MQGSGIVAEREDQTGTVRLCLGSSGDTQSEMATNGSFGYYTIAVKNARERRWVGDGMTLL